MNRFRFENDIALILVNIFNTQLKTISDSEFFFFSFHVVSLRFPTLKAA